MAKYKIVTSSTCITEYDVEANSKKEAEEIWYDFGYLNSKDIDFKNESIQEIHEISP